MVTGLFVAAMALLLAVLVVRQAGDGSQVGWSVLVLLPVLMLAMYGTLRQLVVSLVMAAAVLLIPVATGDDRGSYPGGVTSNAVILVLAVLQGTVVHRFRHALAGKGEISSESPGALRAAEQSLIESLHAMPHPVARFQPVRDEHGVIVDLECQFINVAAVEELGKWTDERSLTAQLEALVNSKVSERWHQVITTGVPATYELGYGSKQDERDPSRLLEVQLVRVGSGVLATWRDVTGVKLQVETLQEAERHWRGLAEIVVDATIEVALDGTVLDASDSIVDLFGVGPSAAIGTAIYAEVHPDDIETVRVGVANAHLAPLFIEFRLYPVEGQPTRWFEAYARANVNRPDSVAVAVREVTKRRTEQDALEHLATHDPLTGALNRAGFIEVVNGLPHSPGSETTFIIYIDLNGFKSVNDEYGHAVGDEVLQTMTSRLHVAMRESDALARLGGDEFAIVGRTNKPAVIALELVPRLEQILSAEILLADGRAVTLGASIGIAVADTAITMSQLIDQADRNMYSKKRSAKALATSDESD